MTAVLVLLGLLAGCSFTTPAGGVTSPSGAIPSAAATAATTDRDRSHRAQQLVDEFVTAARHGASTTALISDRDPVFPARAAIGAANLGRLDWSAMTWSLRPGESEPIETRRTVLGTAAWVQAVDVRWSLAGQTRQAEEQLWLTFVEEPSADGGAPVVRIAGDTDGPRTDAPSPLWWQQPVTAQRAGSTFLLSARPAPRSLAQAAAARAAVRKRIGTADRDPHGALVVELPQSRAVFERTLGVAAGSYAGVAAAAWPMGPDTASAPVHVVVNPELTAQLSDLGRAVLLTHEAVHVATRSPGSPVPTWLVEGYADQIAYRAHPAGAAPAKEAVRELVREKGAPTTWPAEADFAPGAADLDLAYDLAWTAARSIASAYGDDALNRFYAALDRGASVDEAAAQIGTTPKRLRQQWRGDLAELAGR